MELRSGTNSHADASVPDSAMMGKSVSKLSHFFATATLVGLLGVYKNIQQTSRTPVGGIDFNPAALNLQIMRDGKGVPLPLTQQPIEKMKIEGFYPVILNVVPSNIPLLLGLDTKDQKQKPNDLTMNLSLGPVTHDERY